MSYNDSKRIQSIDSIKAYTYRTSKDLIRKNKEIIYANTIKQCKNDKFGDVKGENIKEHNLKCSQITDHVYRILKNGGSGLGKAD